MSKGDTKGFLPKTPAFAAFSLTLSTIAVSSLLVLSAKMVKDWRKANSGIKSTDHRRLSRTGKLMNHPRICGVKILPDTMQHSDLYSFVTCFCFLTYQVLWLIGLVLYQLNLARSVGVLTMLIGALFGQFGIASVMMVLVYRLHVFDDSTYAVSQSTRKKYKVAILVMFLSVNIWHSLYSWDQFNQARSGRQTSKTIRQGLGVLWVMNFLLYASVLFGLVWLFSSKLIAMVNDQTEGSSLAKKHENAASSINLDCIHESTASPADLSVVTPDSPKITDFKMPQRRLLKLAAKQTSLVKSIVAFKMMASAGILVTLTVHHEWAKFLSSLMIQQLTVSIPASVYLSFSFGDDMYSVLCGWCDQRATRSVSHQASLNLSAIHSNSQGSSMNK